jgi:hypothetical protein
MTCVFLKTFQNVDMSNDNVDKDIRELLSQAAKALHRIGELLDSGGGFPLSAQKQVDARICLTCGKKIPPNVRVFRGNHEACYRRVYRKIQLKQMTESEAVAAGLLAPALPGGGGGKVTDDRLVEYLASRDQPRDPDAVAKTFHEKKKELSGKKKKHPAPNETE